MIFDCYDPNDIIWVHSIAYWNLYTTHTKKETFFMSSLISKVAVLRDDFNSFRRATDLISVTSLIRWLF